MFLPVAETRGRGRINQLNRLAGADRHLHRAFRRHNRRGGRWARFGQLRLQFSGRGSRRGGVGGGQLTLSLPESDAGRRRQ